MRQTNFLDTFTLHLTAVSPGDQQGTDLGIKRSESLEREDHLWPEDIIQIPPIG